MNIKKMSRMILLIIFFFISVSLFSFSMIIDKRDTDLRAGIYSISLTILSLIFLFTSVNGLLKIYLSKKLPQKDQNPKKQLLWPILLFISFLISLYFIYSGAAILNEPGGPGLAGIIAYGDFFVGFIFFFASISGALGMYFFHLHKKSKKSEKGE